jgi:hypothetical protein
MSDTEFVPGVAALFERSEMNAALALVIFLRDHGRDFDLLAREQLNLLGAVEWAEDQGEWEMVLALAAGLSKFL